MTPEQTLDWLAQQHFDQCHEERPIQDWIRKMKSQLSEQPAVSETHKQEPVAWMVYTLDGTSVFVTDNPADFTPEHRALPLYTAPPQPSAIARKPLTDKQLNIIGSRWHLNLLNAEEKAELFAFAHAIEAAHGIKE